jgi:hypothetical protein
MLILRVSETLVFETAKPKSIKPQSLHAREGSKILRLIIQTNSDLQELQFLKKQNLIKPKIPEKKK